jgi:hypothetical protein
VADWEVDRANTIASGGSDGTYAVTCRPPSYSSDSVTNSPAIGSACTDSGGGFGTACAGGCLVISVSITFGAPSRSLSSITIVNGITKGSTIDSLPAHHIHGFEIRQAIPSRR